MAWISIVKYCIGYYNLLTPIGSNLTYKNSPRNSPDFDVLPAHFGWPACMHQRFYILRWPVPFNIVENLFKYCFLYQQFCLVDSTGRQFSVLCTLFNNNNNLNNNHHTVLNVNTNSKVLAMFTVNYGFLSSLEIDFVSVLFLNIHLSNLLGNFSYKILLCTIF